MNAEYNLLKEQWIPVQSGGRVSLQELLVQSHKIPDYNFGNALQNLAFIRFLCGMAYRIVRLDNKNDWKQAWKAGGFSDAAKSYLEKFADRFYLFHPKYPFYQDSNIDLYTKKIESINYLNFFSDNESALFTKTFQDTDAELISFADAAIGLISCQLLSPNGGKSSIRRAAVFHQAAQRGVPVVLKGRNLYETILLNCIPRDISKIQGVSDNPIWERDGFYTDNDYRLRGYSDYLTRPARRIKLIYAPAGVSKMYYLTVTAASGKELLQDKSLIGVGDGKLDPFVIYQNTKDGPRSISANENTYLWRNFRNLSLSVNEDSDSLWYQNNINIGTLGSIDPNLLFGYTACIVHMDSKLTKFKSAHESTLLLPVRFIIEDQIRDAIIETIQQVDNAGKLLKISLLNFFKSFTKDRTAQSISRFMAEFWSRSSDKFQQMLGDIETDTGARQSFLNFTRHLANDIFDDATHRIPLTQMDKYINGKFSNAAYCKLVSLIYR